MASQPMSQRLSVFDTFAAHCVVVVVVALSHTQTNVTLFFGTRWMYRTPKDAMGAANAPSWAVFWERFSMT